MAFTAIDLFAGIGGFRLAVERNGGKCLGFSEINEDAIRTYEANFPESRETNFGDITKIVDLPKHDLLTGGVPCQSWSIAGRNLGFDDDRGQLWNDAIYLLNKSRPKAFLFENVKGLIDPRNKNALDYILAKIKDAGYHAAVHVLNSFDYGVPQSRVRIYIVGFRQRKHFANFRLPSPSRQRLHLRDILDDCEDSPIGGTAAESSVERDLFGDLCCPKKSAGVTSLSANNNGFNDYFLLNDIRNGNTTVHSWEILETSEREKAICRLLLTHRRKRDYGELDGNPLSLKHFKALDDTISQSDLDGLCAKGILKPENYVYQVVDANPRDITDSERAVLACAKDSRLVPDELGQIRELKVKRIKIRETLAALNFVEYYFRQDRKRPDYVDADQMELTSSVLLVMRDSAKDSIDNLVTLLIKSNAQDSGRTSQTIDSSFSVDCGSVVWAMGGGLGNASGNLVYRWWIEREWYQQHLYERKCYYWHFSGSLKYHDAFKDPADVLNLIEEDFEVPYGRPYEYGHVWSSQVMDNDGYIWARMVE